MCTKPMYFIRALWGRTRSGATEKPKMQNEAGRSELGGEVAPTLILAANSNSKVLKSEASRLNLAREA